MATKRQAVAQLAAEDLRAVAEAAALAVATKKMVPADAKRVKRAIKVLRTVRAG